MAINGLLSYQIQDGDNEYASFDLPFVNTSSLLADILAWIAAITPTIDAAIDGKILKIRLTLNVPLPGSGIKTSVTAGAENERTALFSMQAAGTANTYGIDVPTFAQADFTRGLVNGSISAVTSLESVFTTASNNCQPTDRYGNTLTAVKRASKTFRKRRKALKRAG